MWTLFFNNISPQNDSKLCLSVVCGSFGNTIDQTYMPILKTKLGWAEIKERKGERGRLNKKVANLFAVCWNCTRLLSEAPDKQVRSKSWGQKRLSSDLSGDERQRLGSALWSPPHQRNLPMRKSTAERVQRSFWFALDYWYLLFPPVKGGAKKRTWLITFVLLQKRNPFVPRGFFGVVVGGEFWGGQLKKEPWNSCFHSWLEERKGES